MDNKDADKLVPRRRNIIRMPLIHLVLILFVGASIYSNTLRAPFVLDDNACIVNNSAIKNLPSLLNSVDGIVNTAIPRTFKMAMFTRPFAFLTFAFNYQLNGLNVYGYHLINTLIHLANALLVYFFVRLGFQSPFFRRHSDNNDNAQESLVPGVAFFAAILFVTHPIQTQAVTYIIQRFASLATFFCLLTLVFYLKSCTSQILFYKRGLYLMSFVSAILAMLTKEIAFTLPVIIMLFEFMFLDGALPRRLARCVPFFLTMAIIPYNLINAKSILSKAENLTGSLNTLAGNPTLSNIDYLLTEFRVIVTYLRLLLFPVNQNLDYDYPEFHSLLSPPVVASVALLTTIIAVGIYLWYQSTKIKSIEAYLYRLAAFGIFWFFITLSVESSIIPIESVIYEHRLYLPSVGFFLSIVSCITILMTRLSPASLLKTGMVPIALAIVAVLAGTTYARNSVWKEETTLWEDVVRKSPENARAHLNLGIAYSVRKQFDYSRREYFTALKLQPNYNKAYFNLGLDSEKTNRHREAIYYYKKSVQTDQDYIQAYINIGRIYQQQGLLQDAVYVYKSVNRINNNCFVGHYNLGKVYYTLGEFENSIKEYLEALRLDPGFAPLYNSLGITYFRLGSHEKAVSMLKKALQLDPSNPNAHSNLQEILQTKIE